MSINFKSIKKMEQAPADIRTSYSLNVFVNNLRIEPLPLTLLTSLLIYFLFLQYALALKCFQQ